MYVNSDWLITHTDWHERYEKYINDIMIATEGEPPRNILGKYSFRRVIRKYEVDIIGYHIIPYNDKDTKI